MDRRVTIHGHFYQPPRENPWLEEVEIQDSAYPFHDWNSRITAEAYAPNAASRILDPESRIIGIMNNYSRISFNFGPTLLSWMARQEPEVYDAIIEADLDSRKRFSGHGSALAQAYNHLIMPLANTRDKRTQVAWGLADFEYRFGRKPEGMWLPETAVDMETLDVLAESGIGFTLLAPRQAKRIRPLDGKETGWRDVSDSNVDPKRPYLCRLPSGRSIAVFFYDGPISRDVAFGGLLDSGEEFANRLMSAFVDGPDEKQLVHIATDGETYGHHHRHGDMAIAYCLHRIEDNQLAKLTIYAEYLEQHPPEYEVEVVENSSWSCVHGIERWRSDCGCATGAHRGWHQRWRAPLRGALDWLRDNLARIYVDGLEGLMPEPWRARDDYISVILDRTPDRIDSFLSRHASGPLDDDQKRRVLMLLEMQRHAMLMYTSCGWFFDELSGIETVQVIQYAARALQLANDVSRISLEKPFVRLLERAPSNIPRVKNGAGVYDEYVRPTILDLRRVGVHYGVASLFEDNGDSEHLYTYLIDRIHYDRLVAGRQKLAVGAIGVRSQVTLEEETITLAALHLGDHNIIGGARKYTDQGNFESIRSALREVFERGDISGVIRLIDGHFPGRNYSLWHLFKDKQRQILEQLLDESRKEVEVSLRQIYERQYPVMQAVSGLRMTMPRYFTMVREFVINTDIRRLFEADEMDFPELERLAAEAQRWPMQIDRQTLDFVAARKIDTMVEQWANDYENTDLLTGAVQLLRSCAELSLDIDAWKAQIAYFNTAHRRLASMKERAAGSICSTVSVSFFE
ncbi:MAG: DUF3536 domain-containing protein [bacterium]